MKQSHAGEEGMGLPALLAKSLALFGPGSCRWRWLSPRGTCVAQLQCRAGAALAACAGCAMLGRLACSGLAAQHGALVPANRTSRVTFAPGLLGEGWSSQHCSLGSDSNVTLSQALSEQPLTCISQFSHSLPAITEPLEVGKSDFLMLLHLLGSQTRSVGLCHVPGTQSLVPAPEGAQGERRGLVWQAGQCCSCASSPSL